MGTVPAAVRSPRAHGNGTVLGAQPGGGTLWDSATTRPCGTRPPPGRASGCPASPAAPFPRLGPAVTASAPAGGAAAPVFAAGGRGARLSGGGAGRASSACLALGCTHPVPVANTLFPD